ncbi:MAG: HEAT repeat domain-containing protein [Candidatus Thorarchaeota archaeon]|jgi:HEAT repeat protein
MSEDTGKENVEKLVHQYLQGREFEELPKLVKLGTKAVPMLTDILRDKKAGYLRQRAAIALGQIGPNEAIKVLGEVVKEETPALQVAVVRALGEIGGNEAEDTLLRLLNHKDTSLRKWVIRTLGKVGGTESQKALRDRLDIEPEDFLRKEIRKSITRVM